MSQPRRLVLNRTALVETLLLAAVLAASSYLGYDLYAQGAAPPPESPFSGTMFFYSDEPEMTVDMVSRVTPVPPADMFIPGQRDEFDDVRGGEFLTVSIRVEPTSPNANLLGKEIFLLLTGDARLTGDPTSDPPGALGRTSYRGWTDGPPEEHVRLPVGVMAQWHRWTVDSDTNHASMRITGRMRSTTTAHAGAMSHVRLPSCYQLETLPQETSSGSFSCGVAMGRISSRVNVVNARPETVNPFVLRWEGKDFLNSPDYLIIDEVLSASLDQKLLAAGALLGVAGAAALELVLRSQRLVRREIIPTAGGRRSKLARTASRSRTRLRRP